MEGEPREQEICDVLPGASGTYTDPPNSEASHQLELRRALARTLGACDTDAPRWPKNDPQRGHLRRERASGPNTSWYVDWPPAGWERSDSRTTRRRRQPSL